MVEIFGAASDVEEEQGAREQKPVYVLAVHGEVLAIFGLQENLWNHVQVDYDEEPVAEKEIIDNDPTGYEEKVWIKGLQKRE